MDQQNSVAARETLAPLTEAQVKDMGEDNYWYDLIYKVDEEIQRLDALAKPDQEEIDLWKRIEESPENLERRFELATLLFEKKRFEDSIPVLLDILAIDRNWKDKSAQNKLMEVFTKLGPTNEAVK